MTGAGSNEPPTRTGDMALLGKRWRTRRDSNPHLLIRRTTMGVY
jgi:hypothetical protein